MDQRKKFLNHGTCRLMIRAINFLTKGKGIMIRKDKISAVRCDTGKQLMIKQRSDEEELRSGTNNQ